ncbi:MAG: hypothetical protein E7314_04705 [Clostridiales bacterium]|nr:hypothetical protein [Clostridiales bacterium]
MIFATDLDNTMIFSHRLIHGAESQVQCVEYYNGKPLTYMTHTSIAKLNSITQKINVIPITTRSIAQFHRIEIFSKLPIVVVDNGGTIFQKGVAHKDWENHISGILKNYNFDDVLKIFSTLPGLTLSPRLVDGKFVFAKSDETDLCKQILQSKLNTKIWQISFQGKKIYAIPTDISKGNALKFINEQLLNNNDPVISAGDSNLDLSMLEYSDYSIVPCDCSLSSPKFIRLGNGIQTSDEILDFVTTLSK